jgi:hypothetical protein
MNELMTRELTKDELSLISGGEHSDNGFTAGFRATHSRERYFRSYQQYDLNGDGDGWDEITAALALLGTDMAISGGIVTLAGGVAVGVPLATAGGIVGSLAVYAAAIDTFGMHYKEP